MRDDILFHRALGKWFSVGRLSCQKYHQNSSISFCFTTSDSISYVDWLDRILNKFVVFSKVLYSLTLVRLVPLELWLGSHLKSYVYKVTCMVANLASWDRQVKNRGGYFISELIARRSYVIREWCHLRIWSSSRAACSYLHSKGLRQSFARHPIEERLKTPTYIVWRVFYGYSFLCG